MTGTFNSKGRTILLVASACAAFVVVVIIVLAFAGRSKVSVQEFDALQQRVLALEARVEKHSLTMDGLEDLRFHPDGKRLAFNSWRFESEAWVMENFLPAGKK